MSISSTPPVPAGTGAVGQVVQGSNSTLPPSTGSLFGGGTVTASSAWITTSAANNVVVVGNYPQKVRRPRRPREKRQVPLFTAGLEAKLNKTLDQDATKILRYITKKVGQPPKIENGVSEDTYEYSTMFQYAIQTGFPWNNPQQLPPIQQHTVRFYARLVLRNDGTLREYEVRMGGAKT
jgi:hypothetical protein